MTYDKRLKRVRKVELKNCDCTTGVDDFGNVRSYPEETVHCENKDGQMRCEVCGG